MIHYFKKPARPEDSDTDLISDTFYRIHPFWLPSLLIGSIIGFPASLLLIICVLSPLLAYGAGSVEILTDIIPFFLIGVALAAFGIFLLWIVTLSWREEDYLAELTRNAESFGLYDSYYIRNLGNFIRQGIVYRCTYLCLTENFIIGSVNTSGVTGPIAIPRWRVKDIYFNLSTYTAAVPGAGRTYYYESGIEITVDNDKVIVIPYGTKQSVGRLMKAIRNAGYNARW